MEFMRNHEEFEEVDADDLDSLATFRQIIGLKTLSVKSGASVAKVGVLVHLPGREQVSLVTLMMVMRVWMVCLLQPHQLEPLVPNDQLLLVPQEDHLVLVLNFRRLCLHWKRLTWRNPHRMLVSQMQSLILVGTSVPTMMKRPIPPMLKKSPVGLQRGVRIESMGI